MIYEAWIFLFWVFLAGLLLFTDVFVIIMFSDLESDFINPIDLCNRLNQFVVPESGIHGFGTLVFLFSGQWSAFFLNVPLFAYNVYKVTNNHHLYDATEVFRTLPGHKRESFVKLGFYLISFFYYLYRLVLALIADGDNS